MAVNHNSPMKREGDELESLLAAFVLEDATEEQVARLNQLLLDDPEARKRACDFLGCEAVLQRNFQLIDRVAVLHEFAILQKTQPRIASLSNLSQASSLPLAKTASRRWRVALTVAVAACVAAMLVVPQLPLGNLRPTDHTASATVELSTGLVAHRFDDASQYNANDSGTSEGNPVRVGDLIRTPTGITHLRFNCGAEVLLKGPAELSILSSMRAELRSGTLTARVSEQAHGFRIDTPNTKVIDLGTEFGVTVDESGATDTVVFTGKVAMEYGGARSNHDQNTENWPRNSKNKLLTEGNALRVTERGQAERIMSVTLSDYPLPGAFPSDVAASSPVIIDVWDNLSTRDTSKAYQIVHTGFDEDVKAFVDRQYQWNGISEQYGLPRMLRGGDYILPFCDDKLQDRIEVTVDLGRPAMLFVLLDNRLAVPPWLEASFTDTGSDVALDEDSFSGDRSWQFLDTGPGNSLERTCSVWAREVPQPQQVVLGAIQPPSHWRVMYGVVAKPLEEVRQGLHDPVAHHQARIGSGVLPSNLLPAPTADAVVERADSFDQVSFGRPDADDLVAFKDGFRFKVQTLDGRLIPHPDTTVLEGGVAPALNDGLAARTYDDPEHSFWYNGQGRFTVDLLRPTRIGTIRCFSRHWRDRSFQKFTVWGARAKVMPPVDFEVAADAKGWDLIGYVNTDTLDPGGVHASQLSPTAESIGPYRHLLWVLEHADRSTFFSEIDVFEFED